MENGRWRGNGCHTQKKTQYDKKFCGGRNNKDCSDVRKLMRTDHKNQKQTQQKNYRSLCVYVSYKKIPISIIHNAAHNRSLSITPLNLNVKNGILRHI